MFNVLYPLLFSPIFVPKVWGGRTLGRFNKNLPGDESNPIGESWELADLDHADSAAPGAAGEAAAARTRVVNGPLAGRTLKELIRSEGKPLMGYLEPTATGCFPLLVKYLDARQNLSVQVHPSPAYAAAHPEAHLKNEAWYILAADPGAVIYKGIKPGVTAGAFRAAIADGTLPELMISLPAKPGDCHYLPSGTCHALGAGILVAEVQTPSDTTFRIYDWGRPNRKLHIEEALECIDFDAAPPEEEPPVHLNRTYAGASILTQCEDFRVDRLWMAPAALLEDGFSEPMPITHYGEAAVWMVLEGRAILETDCPEEPSLEIRAGDTLLLPAATRNPRLRLAEKTLWLETSFPRASRHILA